LAERLVLPGPASEELGRSIAQKLGLPLLAAELKVFLDGESKFTCDQPVSGKTVLVVQSTYHPVDQHLFQLMLASHKLSQDGARVIAVVPYLAYARQDKEFLPGEAVTLAFVAHLMRSSGVARLATVDIHSAQGLSLFSFPVYSVSAVPAMVDYVRNNLTLENPVIISPDFGASKRTEAFAQLYGAKSLQLSKSRDRSTGEVKIKQEELHVEGRDVLFLDEVVTTGATIRAATEMVLGQGAKSASVVCTHGVFAGDTVEKLEKAGVKNIVTTNTIPGRFSKVDVAEALASHLRTLEE
jgi:ribose-phosphate pyrophosphokinase